MKLSKKLKYVLGSVGLAGLAIIPASVGLVSCSKKEEKDVIEYYQDAQGAIFEGQPMQKGSYPFKCDFNLTNKTCAIVDWTSGEPNYMTEGLPDREGLGTEDMQKINNTVRIPSQIIYNGEEFSVVAFATFKGSTNNTYKLDLSKITNNLIQLLEFDKDLTEINSKLSINDEGRYIGYPSNAGVRQPNLLKVLNYPNVVMKLSGSEKLNEITFNSKRASFPAIDNCISIINIDMPFIDNVGVQFSIGAQGCIKLKKAKFSNGAIYINSYAFQNCTSLSSIDLPNTITKIYNNAFENCSSLESITIPESVTEFGYNIFKGSHTSTFKIYFHSEEQKQLFLSSNYDMEQYCMVIQD